MKEYVKIEQKAKLKEVEAIRNHRCLRRLISQQHINPFNKLLNKMIIKSKNPKFELRYARKSDLDSYYNNKKNDQALYKGFWTYKLHYTNKMAKEDLNKAIED